jgi:hypothetical protein
MDVWEAPMAGRIRRSAAVLGFMLLVLVPARPAAAADGIVVDDLTFYIGGPAQMMMIHPPAAAVAARDQFSITLPDAARLATQTQPGGGGCSGGSNGAWTGCSADSNGKLWITFEPGASYVINGQDFTLTVADETTGAVGTGTLHVRSSADLELEGPFPANGPALLYTIYNHGPSRSESTTLDVTFAGHAVTQGLQTGCTQSGQQLHCDLGIIESNSGNPFKQITIPLASATSAITMHSTAASSTADPNPANNVTQSDVFDLFGNGPPGSPTSVHNGGSGAGDGGGAAPPGAAATTAAPTTAASATLPPTTAAASATAAVPDLAPNRASAASSSGSGVDAWLLGIAIVLPLLAIAGGFVGWRFFRRRDTPQ